MWQSPSENPGVHVLRKHTEKIVREKRHPCLSTVNFLLRAPYLSSTRKGPLIPCKSEHRRCSHSYYLSYVLALYQTVKTLAYGKGIKAVTTSIVCGRCIADTAVLWTRAVEGGELLHTYRIICCYAVPTTLYSCTTTTACKSHHTLKQVTGQQTSNPTSSVGRSHSLGPLRGGCIHLGEAVALNR